MGYRLVSVLKEKSAAPIVCVRVGGTDIAKVKNGKLRKIYKMSLRHNHDIRGMSVICIVLPRRGGPSEWLSRATAMNSWLADQSRNNGGRSWITGTVFTARTLCSSWTRFVSYVRALRL